MQFLPCLSHDLDGFDQMPHAAKLLYLVAQICEVDSLSELARRAGIGERTAFRMSRLLRKHKWFKVERRGRNSVPIPVLPPAEDERRARLFKTCYEVSQYKGEFILRGLADATLLLEGKVDNARPDFLKSPLSGENLEYDIFSPATLDAWELQGFQHSGPTDAFPSKEKAKQQQANDLMKVGRSVENGIRLVVMTYKDLSLDGMLKSLPSHLPKRPIDRTSRYIRAIEKLATNYRQWAARTEEALKARQDSEE